MNPSGSSSVNCEETEVVSQACSARASTGEQNNIKKIAIDSSAVDNTESDDEYQTSRGKWKVLVRKRPIRGRLGPPKVVSFKKKEHRVICPRQ